LGDLGDALNILGISYSATGQPREATEPAEEAVSIFRQLAETNPAYTAKLATALNNLAYVQQTLGGAEQAKRIYEESIVLYASLAATNREFEEGLQRTRNNLEVLQRQQRLAAGDLQELASDDIRYLPIGDPNTFLRRSVVRVWPTFAGRVSGIGGQSGTAFVVKRQGDRAWIATALHVVLGPDDRRPPIKLEAELYTGPLPTGIAAPRRLPVVLPLPMRSDQDDLIVLEVKGLPADVKPLPLALQLPTGVLKVIGHPGNRSWDVGSFGVLKVKDRKMMLDGQLDEGASGSPVLNAAGQVVGLVSDAVTTGRGEFQFVIAYRSPVIQVIIP
jgi:superkiller protein 3